MSAVRDSGVVAPFVTVRDWFRRDVESRLSEQVGGPARLRVIVLLACVLALDSADKATIGSTAVQLEAALHVGNTQIGLLVTVSTAIGAVATLPLGVLTDRINRTRLLSVAIIVWSAAMVVSGLSSSYLMLLLTRLALGGVVATAGPVIASLAGDLFPAVERGRMYGYILSGELIGTGIGFLVSGDVAAVLSWRYSFWVLAVPGFVLAWAILRLLPEPARGGQARLTVGAEHITTADEAADNGGTSADDPPPEGDEQVARQVEEQHIRPHDELVLHEDPTGRSVWWAVRYVLSVRTNRILIIASALGYFYFGGLRTFAVVFLRGRFDIGQGLGSTLLVVIGVGAILGVLAAGPLADKLIGAGHLPARPAVAGVAFLLAVALFVPALLSSALAVTAVLAFLAAAGIGGANPPLDAARLDLMHSRLWGRAEAVRTALRTAFEAIAPLLFGYVSGLLGARTTGLGHPTGTAHGDGLDHTFLIMLIVLLAAGLLLLLRARRSYPRDVATALASQRSTEGEGTRTGG
jgi:predicted MFS family arabinose efflux permease